MPALPVVGAKLQDERDNDRRDSNRANDPGIDHEGQQQHSCHDLEDENLGFTFHRLTLEAAGPVG
jgi:hypothetical protein